MQKFQGGAAFLCGPTKMQASGFLLRISVI